MMQRRAFRSALLFEGGLGIVAVAAGWLFGCNPLDSLSWQASALAFGAASTLPMLAFFSLALSAPLEPLRRIRAKLDEMLIPLFSRSSVAEIALLSAAAGFGEELLFRGLIQGALAAPLGTSAAVCAASLAFGLAHPITATYTVFAAAMGAFLSGVWLLSGNLLAPITAHAVYDFVALYALLRRSPESVEASSQS